MGLDPALVAACLRASAAACRALDAAALPDALLDEQAARLGASAKRLHAATLAAVLARGGDLREGAREAAGYLAELLVRAVPLGPP